MEYAVEHIKLVNHGRRFYYKKAQRLTKCIKYLVELSKLLCDSVLCLIYYDAFEIIVIAQS